MDERALSFWEAIFKILCLCPLYNSCVRERERRRIIDILNLEQAGNHNDEEGKKHTMETIAGGDTFSCFTIPFHFTTNTFFIITMTVFFFPWPKLN